MSNYWAKRLERAQTAISNVTEQEIDEQLKRYYKDAMNNVISEFEATYDKLLATIEKGQEPTPADLYKLDRYWQMQSNLNQEMQRLGDKEIALMSEKFEEQWQDVYNTFAIKSDSAFSTISTANAKQMINTSWLPDGKNFSQRVWGNTSKLTETLNEQIIHCVVTGKKTTELKNLLQERFGVSYRQAKTLVNTEIANIQTQAAAQRYKDYGLQRYEFLGREETTGCNHSPSCHELNGKKFLLSEMKAGVNAPPMHPNCRCCIVPVVDNKEMEENIMVDKYMNTCVRCGKVFETEYSHIKVCTECRKEIEEHNKQVLGDNEKRLRKLKSDGMSNENVETIRNAWNEGRNADVSELKLYRRKCAYCGGTIESPYRYGKVYHDRCLKELEFDNLKEIVTCIDCGESFIRYKKYKNQVRCPECQAKYRKKYKAEKQKEYRTKNK